MIEQAKTMAMHLKHELVARVVVSAACALGATSLAVAGPLADETQIVVAQAAPQPMNAAPASPATGGGKARAKGFTEAAPDSGVTRRVEQLEEQIVDMQVTVGTLESMSRSGGGAPRSNGGSAMSAADGGRVDSLETQVRALAAEVQRLNAEIKRLGGSGSPAVRGDAGGAAGGLADAGPAVTYTPPPSSTSARREPAPSFGSTTVTPSGDPIGTLIEGAPGGGAAAARPFGETQVAGLPPAAAAGNAKQDYEAAYGHLLRQDYGAAEAAFEAFLKSYPADPLAGNAQYWLGETHFVRGSYKPAAAAFLKGYQNFAKSNKAPDSLLKLAMSLDRLGQKDAACSSFGELVGKFPDAPSHVKSRAASEQKRLGCR